MWFNLIQTVLSHLCVCQQVDLEWWLHCKTLLTDWTFVCWNRTEHITEAQVLYLTNHMMHQDFTRQVVGEIFYSHVKHLWAMRESQKNCILHVQAKKCVMVQKMYVVTGGSPSAVWCLSLSSQPFTWSKLLIQDSILLQAAYDADWLAQPSLQHVKKNWFCVKRDLSPL